MVCDCDGLLVLTVECRWLPWMVPGAGEKGVTQARRAMPTSLICQCIASAAFGHISDLNLSSALAGLLLSMIIMTTQRTRRLSEPVSTRFLGTLSRSPCPGSLWASVCGGSASKTGSTGQSSCLSLDAWWGITDNARPGKPRLVANRLT
jgi:hypothetical protein